MKDIELREQVERALEFEPSIDAADIGVAVENGIVTLSGHVATYPQKFTAERVVQGVRGVRGISEQIEVRNSASKTLTDDQLVERVLNSLAWDITVPDDKIKVKVQRGWVTLTGKVNWDFQRRAAERAVRTLSGVIGVSSELAIEPVVKVGDIRHRIEEALKRSAEIEASGVTIDVKDDKVTLAGSVHSWAERRAIERAAWAAPGVVSIDDKLIVA